MSIKKTVYQGCINLQKGKWKQDPGPMQATARKVKKQYSVGLD